MSCGIYKIECLKNNKVYIGLSIDIERRWKRHTTELEDNKHQNVYMQRAWNKYGKEYFTFEILEECEKDSLSEKEIKFIEEYDSYKNGFNMTVGGDGGLSGYKRSKESVEKTRLKLIGKKRTEETRKKISESKMGHKVTKASKEKISNTLKLKYKNGEINKEKMIRKGKDNSNSIPVYQFDIDTLKIIKMFDCIRDAEKEIGHDNGVQDCIEGEQISCGGYYWQKASDTIENKYVGKIKTKNYSSSKQVYQLDKDTEKVLNEFMSMSDANEYLGLKRTNNGISCALIGLQKTAHGYKWRYKI